MPDYTLKNVSPKLEVDTSDIQGNTPTTDSKYNKTTGKMTESATGICATLVSFWLSREFEGKPVRAPGDFPSGFKLAIAQGAYIMDPRGGGKDTAALLDVFGTKVVTSKLKKSKWYNMKATKVEEAVAQAVKMPGIYYFGIVGDGGHALGLATKHYAQFFDPNFGIFSFKSLNDLKTWVPAFVKKTYPDLLESTKLFGVG